MRLFRYLEGMYTSYSNIVYKNILYQYRTRNQWYTTSSCDFNLVINGVNINRYVNKLEEEYNILKQNAKNKERYLEIEPAMQILKERRKAVEMIGNLNELLNDKDEEIRKLAVEEKTSFLDKITTIDKQLETALLNIGSVNNYDSIVLEVNSGVGGQEAMLFANELFKMYCGFIEYKGWNYEIAEYTTTDLGGIRHGSVLINGEDVFRYFQHEAGVHRVQRIPNTEKSGRIHTSTASVLALPQPRDIDISLQSKDLRIDTKRASGAGGQHVNTTDSAVRITHLPSRISVECQADRSQIRNREIAMQRLRAKLYDMQLQKQEEEMLKTKKIQVKSNFRNEKIRTYNYSQDRITDHRLQQANLYNLKYFMQGNEMLENLIDKLDYKFKIDNLLAIVDNLNKET